jgi:FkbM family methyltransferase
MLNLDEFRRTGKSRKFTSWISDPVRFLICSFLWPYFKRVLTELEELRQTNTWHMDLAGRVDEITGKQVHLGARFEGVQKEVMAVASRLGSIERLFAGYKEKNLYLEDGGKIFVQGTSLVIAAGKYGRFLLRQPDIISQAVMEKKYWDPHLKSIIENVGSQELVAIDVGSYFGFHAIHMARHFRQVYAFEPQTRIFQMLCANILLNEMKNITAFNNALYEYECFMRLSPAAAQKIPVPFIGSTIDYDRIENAGALTFELADKSSVDSIRALTIDSLNLDDVGLIKIDTQGNDLSVLKGARETISRCRPIIVFEYEKELSHLESFVHFEEYFEGLHYDLKLLTTQVEGKQSDYLATPRPQI